MSEKSTNWKSTIHDINARQIKRAETAAKREQEDLLKIIEQQADQVNVALSIGDHTPNIHKITKIKSGRKGSAVACAIASDWHVEEPVRGESVNGLNEFNLKIAEKRIENFFKSSLKLVEIQRGGVKIDKLLLALLGDFMTGFIHEELMQTNELTPTETVLWLIDQISSGLKFLEPHFEQIIIPCSYGNHGRTTVKSRHATGPRMSYEWMMYHLLAREFPQFQWEIADSYHHYVEVDGRKIRFHHGDGLRYQGGVGGLTIPVEKAIASWNKGITAYLDVFGHWHTSLQTNKFVSNGSLIGYNAYAVSIKAAYEPASQSFFLLDKERGKTISAPIFLD